MTRKKLSKSTPSTTISDENEVDASENSSSADASAALTKKSKKSKEDEEPVKTFAEQRADKLQAVMGAVSKKYGAHALAGVGKASYRPLIRFSCGILQIDQGLGGGIPKGRVTMFVGDYSAGKTDKVLRSIADAQKRSAINNLYLWEEMPESEQVPNNCLFIDMEGTFDGLWAQHLGVDIERLSLSRPETLEEAADILLVALQSGAYDVVALDSIAQMIPEDEAESSMDEKSFGTAAAKKNNSMFRRIQSTLNRLYKESEGGAGAQPPTVIFTNQTRDKIGVMWGDKTTMPGGRGQEFYASCIVQCWAEGVDHFDDEKSMPKSGRFGFKVKKNKSAPARIEGKFVMALGDDPSGKFKGGDVLEGQYVYETAEKLGIIGKREKPDRYFCFDDEYKTKRELTLNWFYDRQKYLILKRAILKILCPKQ